MGGQPAGKVALVSRVGSGIGRAAALACANVGARAVASAGDASGGEETSRRMAAAGAEGLGVRADVSRASNVSALVEWTIPVGCQNSRFGLVPPKTA